MGNLIKGLKQRKVFRVGLVYGIIAWVLIQIADIVLPTFGAPEWVNQTVIFILVLAFPPIIIAAWAIDSASQKISVQPSPSIKIDKSTSTEKGLIYAILGLLLLIVAFQLNDRFFTNEDQSSPAFGNSLQGAGLTKISVNIPESEYFHPSRGDLDISDDGSMFVYRGSDGNGDPLLWQRRWDELNGRPIPGTEGATRPNISPDGSEVVFHSGGRVRVHPLNGGLSRILTEGGSDTPNWSPDGNWIYFTNRRGMGISRVPSAGGEIENISTVIRDNGEIEHQAVQVPAENRIIYEAQREDQTSLIQGINLDTGETKDIILGKWPIYSHTGHLLFQALDAPVLLVAPFNLETLELTDTAVPIENGLLLVGLGNAASIGLSNSGRLIYRLGSNVGRSGTPMAVNREGIAREIDPGWIVPTDFTSSSLAISPDGGRLAISISTGGQNSDLWVKRLDTGPLSRITFTGEGNYHPTWSADGNSLGFIGGRIGNNRVLHSKRADGSGGIETLMERTGFYIDESDFSRDGKWLVYRERAETTNFRNGSLYALDMSKESEPIPLVVNDFYNHSPVLSPDSRWLAYVSRESGRDEVYVRPFPDTDSGRWQISSDGGSEPLWSHSGKELFYKSSDEELIVVQLSDGDAFAWDDQNMLFSTADYRSSPQHQAYDIFPDDQRFLMIKLEAADDTEFILVDNWIEIIR